MVGCLTQHNRASPSFPKATLYFIPDDHEDLIKIHYPVCDLPSIPEFPTWMYNLDSHSGVLLVVLLVPSEQGSSLIHCRIAPSAQRIART